jgi:hypothetical protein
VQVGNLDAEWADSHVGGNVDREEAWDTDYSRSAMFGRSRCNRDLCTGTTIPTDEHVHINGHQLHREGSHSPSLQPKVSRFS